MDSASQIQKNDVINLCAVAYKLRVLTPIICKLTVTETEKK